MNRARFTLLTSLMMMSIMNGESSPKQETVTVTKKMLDEYELIKLKKSKLSASERKRIVYYVERLYNQDGTRK